MDEPTTPNRTEPFRSNQCRQFHDGVRRVLVGNGQSQEQIEAFMADLPRPMPPPPREGLDRLVGLEEIKALARRSIEACRAKGRLFPSTLLSGAIGSGRRSLSAAIAEELDAPYSELRAYQFDSKEEFAKSVRSKVKDAGSCLKRMVLFADLTGDTIDARDVVEHVLLLTRRKARRHVGPMLPITVLTAVPLVEGLPLSFLRLFRQGWHLGHYNVDDLQEIIKEHFLARGLWVRYEASRLLAERSFGLPGRALWLAESVTQFVERCGDNTAFPDHVHEACYLLLVDSRGLTEHHQRCLLVLLEAGRQGCDLPTLASSLSLPERLLSEAIEPDLAWLQMVSYGHGGRMRLSNEGHRHLAGEGLL